MGKFSFGKTSSEQLAEINPVLSGLKVLIDDVETDDYIQSYKIIRVKHKDKNINEDSKVTIVGSSYVWYDNGFITKPVKFITKVKDNKIRYILPVEPTRGALS